MVARSYVSGSFRLQVDGHDAGPLYAFEGGEPYAEVVEDLAGKHLGPVGYSDMVIACDLVPAAALMSWVSAALGGSSASRSGAVVETDYDGREIARLTFDAVIREVGFPAADAVSKESAHLTLRLAPVTTRRQAGSATKGSGKSVGVSKAQQASGFRLTVSGLTTTYVTRVEPLGVRLEVPTLSGAATEPGPVHASLVLPDLVVTLRESNDWYAWRDAFIVNRTGAERTGMLEYLARDLRSVLARLDFTGLGLHSLVAERSPASGKAGRRVRAAMYCEHLSYSPTASAAPATADEAPPPPPPPTAAPAGAGLRPAVPSRVDVIASLAERVAAARSGLG